MLNITELHKQKDVMYGSKLLH